MTRCFCLVLDVQLSSYRVRQRLDFLCSLQDRRLVFLVCGFHVGASTPVECGGWRLSVGLGGFFDEGEGLFDCFGDVAGFGEDRQVQGVGFGLFDGADVEVPADAGTPT